MSEAPKYIFRIEHYTPENMPFGRLLDYYIEIKKMLGVAEGLHLTELINASHGSAFAIDRNYETQLERRLYEINKGTANKPVKRSYDTINAMLKEDGTSGCFSNPQGQNIIVFPGKRAEDEVSLSIRDSAQFVGELYHISGMKNDARARIYTDSYGVVFCTTTREIAKSLRDFLFEDVKVSGRGTWSRAPSGDWEISDFTITDFASIRGESLRSAIDRIRGLDIAWPPNVLDQIATFDEKDEAPHQ